MIEERWHGVRKYSVYFEMRWENDFYIIGVLVGFVVGGDEL